MFRLLPVKGIADRKKVLLVQSDLHRRTLQLQFVMLQQSGAHLKKRLAIVGISSMAVSLGAAVTGLFVAKKSSGKPSGLMSKLLSGVSVFNQIKGFLSRVKPSANEPS
jgi:hypothetical protein